MPITDPDKFQEEADKIIRDFIDSVPERHRVRLEQCQWRIDNELRKYKDPVARMNRMVELFWEGFNEFNGELRNFAVTTTKIPIILDKKA